MPILENYNQMDSFTLGLIIFIGILVSFIVLMSLPSEQIFCDVDCKLHFENEGMRCEQISYNEYACKQRSRYGVDVVVPFGSSDVELNRNFIPQSITVSIGINNTVRWTNLDSTSKTIVSDSGLFGSPVLLPNQSWAFVFEKEGNYGYHSNPSPWLNGKVNVVHFDPNYQKGHGIELLVFPNFDVSYYLMRETDSVGYVGKMSIINSKTISVTLRDYPEINPESSNVDLTLRLGDKIIGGCSDIGKQTRIYYKTLEKIETENTPYVEFREEHTTSNQLCNFEELVKEYR